jgi:peptidyl-prolyl cis-trans isomerase SurA
VEPQVEEAFYMVRMEPAMRGYLTKMREDAYIDLKPGFVDTGASPRQTKPVYSAYVPPSPKKKKKIARTRFRETTRTFRQKSPQIAATAAPETATAPAPDKKKSKKNASADTMASMKPGKKEKIRLGHAPTKTLPNAPETKTEDAGAVQQAAANTSPEPENPLESSAPEKKTRFSSRAKLPKQPKAQGLQPDALAPTAPDAAEVADRQTQAGPLGLAGDTASKKKKKSTTTGDKTRLSDKKKTETQTSGDVPLAPAPLPAASQAPGQVQAPQPQK